MACCWVASNMTAYTPYTSFAFRAGYDGRGVRIFDQGSGPPLIVIPGVQGRQEWFAPTFAALKSRCRTISFTLAAPMTPGLMAGRIVESQAIDFSLDCVAVQAPTLVISGEPHLDRIVPVESTRKYAEMIRGAKYVMLERTGHLGMVTRPAEWAEIVTEFVSENK